MSITIAGVYKLVERAKIPNFATELSACADLHACFYNKEIKYHGALEPQFVQKFGTDDAFIRMYPGDMVLVPTGLKLCIPKGYCLDIRSRSGNAWKRFITVVNQPGTIDSDYTDETFVLLYNNSKHMQVIKDGDAIAQCKLNELVQTDFVEINTDQFCVFFDSIKKNSSRDGGFGSTDNK